MEAGTTPNGVFGAKLMWGYFGDFVSLLRNIPAYSELLARRAAAGGFPEPAPSSASSAPTRCARRSRCGRRCRRRPGARRTRRPVTAVSDDGSPPYKSFLADHRPQLRFHYGAIEHLLHQILIEEAHWDAFFEHARIKPVLVLYENFAADYEHATRNVLERLGLELPEGHEVKPRMKSQSDGINDDWTRRYADLKLGTQFDLVPAAGAAA